MLYSGFYDQCIFYSYASPCTGIVPKYTDSLYLGSKLAALVASCLHRMSRVSCQARGFVYYDY